MEPISITVVATLLLTKAVEKIGEEFGAMALHQVGRLRQLIQHKDPNTATAISRVAQQSCLAEADPARYRAQVQEIQTQLQLLANADSEVFEAVKAVAEAADKQPEAVQGLSVNADKIGLLAHNSVINNPTINI
jgi:uncharacterized membrane protein